MIYKFNVSVITDRILDNDDKSEVMEAIKANIGRIKKSGGHILHDSEIQVTREVSLEDIGQAMGISTTDSQTREKCHYYDQAQGRDFCVNPLVKDNKCEGVCKHFWTGIIKEK